MYMYFDMIANYSIDGSHIVIQEPTNNAMYYLLQ